MARLLYPNGPQDQQGILNYDKAAREMHRPFWTAVETQAWKNILFYLGLQRIQYSPAVRFWRPKTQDRKFLPVTNMVKTLVNDLASKLIAFKPPITWGPGSDQDTDYIAASVADFVNTINEREANIRELKPLCARWLASTGNVWLVNNYDTSPENGESFEPAQRCLHCLTPSMPMEREQTGGMCPTCGSREMGVGPMGPMEQQNPQFEPAIDGSGVPVGISYPKGKHVTEVENVFTVRFDPYADRFHKSPYVAITRTRPYSWVAERYGEPFADQAAYRGGNDLTTRLFDGLAVTAFGMAGSGSASDDEQKAVVTRLWIRPHPEKAPNGIYAEIVGDQIATGRDGQPIAREYPYHDETGKAMLNIVHLEFDQVPGRALASTRMDDAVELQEDLNEYDAFIKQHARRMSNAVWINPRGSNVSSLTGEGGLEIQYDPLQTGHKPERAAGVPLEQTLFLVRNQKKAEMQEVFGLPEVARGEVPSRVTAYAALQLLDERAQQGQSNIFDNWALGWMEWSRQNINIAREYWTEERMLSLGFGKWATRKFAKAQIQGGVDITVDLGMNRPTTLIAKSARIGQAITQGLVNPLDPQQRFQGLRALGIPELMPDYNKDYIKAGRMLDRILEALDPSQLPPPPQPYDIHPIHLQVLRQFEIDEAFESLEPWKQQAIQLRAAIHFQAMRQDVIGQSMKPGSNAPRMGGDGGGTGGEEEKDDYTSEDTVLDKETQGASPDTMQGVSANMSMGA